MTAASVSRFAIAGDACPQLALRVLGLFAQQDLLPAEVTIRCSEDALDIAIVQPALDPLRAGIIAEKMRAMIMVREVIAEWA
jgi:hypothetical protein